MKFYLVERTDVVVGGEEHEWVVFSAHELSDGGGIMAANEVQVPFSLDGDNVTIYLDKAIGKLDRATVSGMGDDWTIANRGAVKEVTLVVEEGDAPIHIFSTEGHPALLIERHEEAPTVFDWSLRK